MSTHILQMCGSHWLCDDPQNDYFGLNMVANFLLHKATLKKLCHKTA